MSEREQRAWLRRMKGLLALVLLAGVVAYLVRNAGALQGLPTLSAAAWAWVFAITAVGTVLSALAVQLLVAAVGTRTGFGEMYLLHNAAHLLNLLPAKLGTVLRARYLKKHHDFSYLRFGLFALYLTLLTNLATALIGLVCLVAAFGLGSTTHVVFASLLAASVAVTSTALFVPLPVPSAAPERFARVVGFLARILEARRELLGRGRLLLAPAALPIVVYLLGAVRLGLIYHGMGLEPDVAGLLLLGALGQVSQVANLTPGGLGVRELVLGVGATILGVSAEAGLLAALIERAVGLAWALVVGVPCAAWALRRQRLEPDLPPGDEAEAGGPPAALP